MAAADDERSRLCALLTNSGLCGVEDAETMLASAAVTISIGDAAGDAVGQAALLTAVATAVRCFGQVYVVGVSDEELIVPLPLGAATLTEGVTRLGAHLGPAPSTVFATIAIGPGDAAPESIRAVWHGWNAGVMPGSQHPSQSKKICVLAGIAAGAMAVGQAFRMLQGDRSASKAVQWISLWSQETRAAQPTDPGPETFYLPEALWLIGLGNLGQAYAWALAALPYNTAMPRVFLQDFDRVKRENWGTSLLVEHGRYGALKTQIVERWMEQRGFRVYRVDRRLGPDLKRTDEEPGLALAGLDRMPPRRQLAHVGFEYIIDGGLSAVAQNYDTFRINVFDKLHDPARHFDGVQDEDAQRHVEALLQLPAYQEYQRRHPGNRCGTAELAGRSVATPFVGAFVGAVVVAQAIRLASASAPHISIKGSLRDLRNVRHTLGVKATQLKLGHAEKITSDAYESA